MPFNIGNVVSPEVARALIRKGENRGAGAGISRRDPIRRTETTDRSAENDLAFRREERLRELQDAQLAASERREAFDRERFDAGRADRQAEQERDQRNRDADREAKGLSRGSATTAKARDRAVQITNKIGGLLAQARKPHPDTGEPDPRAMQQAGQVIAALWQQLTALGLPQEEVDQIREQIQGVLPSTPAPRAGAGSFDRGASGSRPGFDLDVVLQRELSTPNRTP